MAAEPTTLREAILYLADPTNCREYLVARRWPDGVVESMKPLPAPHVAGDTEAERMSNAVRKMFSVSKEELLKREAKWKQD